MRYTDLSSREYAELLSSSSPVPGGGGEVNVPAGGAEGGQIEGEALRDAHVPAGGGNGEGLKDLLRQEKQRQKMAVMLHHSRQFRKTSVT